MRWWVYAKDAALEVPATVVHVLARTAWFLARDCRLHACGVPVVEMITDCGSIMLCCCVGALGGTAPTGVRLGRGDPEACY